MNYDLYSPFTAPTSEDAADEFPRVPLAAVMGAFSALLFAVSCIVAAVVYAVKG